MVLGQQEKDHWVPEEDPQVAMMRIAKETSQWFSKYRIPTPGDPNMSYEAILSILQRCWDLVHSDDFKNGPEELKGIIQQRVDWVKLCCNGANPVAALVWVEMVPRIREAFPGSDWLLEVVSPIDLDLEYGVCIYGVDSMEIAEKVWKNHVQILRWGLKEILPFRSQGLRLEVWDRDMNVWGDGGGEAA